MDQISRDAGQRAVAERKVETLTGMKMRFEDCAIERYDERVARYEPQFAALEASVGSLLERGAPSKRETGS